MHSVRLILVLVLAACSDAVEPVSTPEGTVSFSYTGEIQGWFDVTGAYPPPGEACDECAFAIPSVQGDRLLLQAYRARGQLLDILTMTIAYPAEPGRYGPEIPSDFAYGVPAPGQPEYAFRLVSGDVVIAGLEGQRIRGEFTAVGEDVDFFADPQVRNLQVANGSFDVPILERR